jgi:dethiobiotin synthetase
MRGLFVTGTDTEAGKTILSAALCAAIAAAGEPVRAYKPVLTGLDEPPGEWPHDDELLAAVTGQSPREVAPLRFGPAVSPHLAAKMANEPIDPESLHASAHRAGASDAGGATPVLVVEGVGGLMVPLADGFLVRDLAARLGLPIVIAARPGLGTISHTLLTIEAARAGGLGVAAVVLTPWPVEPGAIELSNRDTIASLSGVEVQTLPRIGTPTNDALAAAAAALPWRGWLGRS